jgi:hypothetical protein
MTQASSNPRSVTLHQGPTVEVQLESRHFKTEVQVILHLVMTQVQVVTVPQTLAALVKHLPLNLVGVDSVVSVAVKQGVNQ